MNYLIACVLTLLIELPVFFAAGYRSRGDLCIVACTNIVTNLLVNLAAALLLPGRGPAEYALEAAVVGVEFGVYALAFGPTARLFYLTLAANALSCSIGLLLF